MRLNYIERWRDFQLLPLSKSGFYIDIIIITGRVYYVYPREFSKINIKYSLKAHYAPEMDLFLFFRSFLPLVPCYSLIAQPSEPSFCFSLPFGNL
jgi:hypothetical protein